MPVSTLPDMRKMVWREVADICKARGIALSDGRGRISKQRLVAKLEQSDGVPLDTGDPDPPEPTVAQAEPPTSPAVQRPLSRHGFGEKTVHALAINSPTGVKLVLVYGRAHDGKGGWRDLDMDQHGEIVRQALSECTCEVCSPYRRDK